MRQLALHAYAELLGVRSLIAGIENVGAGLEEVQARHALCSQCAELRKEQRHLRVQQVKEVPSREFGWNSREVDRSSYGRIDQIQRRGKPGNLRERDRVPEEVSG